MSPARGRQRKRHANREGSPWFNSAKGLWTARVWPPKGSIETRPRQVWAATREECIAKRDKLRAELAAAVPASGDPGLTVGEYLEGWLGTTLDQYVRAGRMADSTRDSYRDNARLHILPYLAHIPLRELSAPMLRQWQDKLLRKRSARTPRKVAEGERAPRQPGLSARTVNYCRAILHKAIRDAIRDGVAGLDQNVVDRVEPAEDRSKQDRSAITREEATAILLAASEDDLWCYWLIGFALGYRRGEGLGMRWPDLDLSSRVWRPAFQVRRVRGEPDRTGKRAGRLMLVPLKTAASRKPVGLPGYVVQALTLWESQQNGARATARAWSDLGLVFCTRVGTALEPRNVNRAWARVCERAGTRPVGIHDLRHACATYLLDEGVSLKVVQNQLRHARLATTELYVHALEEIPMTAADAMDRVLERLAPALPQPPETVKRRLNAVPTAVLSPLGKVKQLP